jgi:hypothetical protein
MNSGKWSILELFGRFYAQEWRKHENQEKSGNNTRRRQALELTPSPFEEMRWNLTLGAPEKKLEVITGRRKVQMRWGRPALHLQEAAQKSYKGTASEGLLGYTKP